jgi:hypothetical protein
MFKKVTTALLTPTRPPVIPIVIGPDKSITFDMINDYGGWHSDFPANFGWLQTNGNLSLFSGTYGPGSDFKSIS